MTHLDKFCAEVDVGDYVCGSYSNGLAVFRVVDITPKMIKIQHYLGKTERSIRSCYARDVIKLTELQEQSLLMEVLKGE
jgi:hypothetical protein